jgi:hypothetical protein
MTPPLEVILSSSLGLSFRCREGKSMYSEQKFLMLLQDRAHGRSISFKSVNDKSTLMSFFQ